MSHPSSTHEVSAGGILVRRSHGHDEVCLVRRARHGREAWSLPKGHVEAGEDAASTALREVREETGVVGELLAPLEPITYRFTRHEATVVSKHVTFFLMRARRLEPEGHDTTEVTEVRWFAWDEAMARLAYENERRVLAQAHQLLSQPEFSAKISDDPLA